MTRVTTVAARSFAIARLVNQNCVIVPALYWGVLAPLIGGPSMFGAYGVPVVVPQSSL